MEQIKRRIIDEFNLRKQADDLGVKVWQTPSFMFIVMGLVIVAAMTGVDIISQYYDSPNVLIVSETLVVSILFIIGYFVIHSIESVAQANKMKSEFVAIASHQLKTPIAEMNWQTELLLSKFHEGLSEKQAEIVHEIVHSSSKMARLVNDLLDVARIDQGQLALTKDRVDMCTLVKDVVDSEMAFAKTAGVQVRNTCPAASFEVIGDRRRLSVALDNLISNAIKYTEKGGIVEVILEANGQELQICVRDNGVGIPRSEQVRIFQKFFRSNNSVKNKTDGTGLGLYIAKNIVEQSGGKLWFQSIEHAGSEFYFTLPLA
ncbi:MAG TPA: HAMP domain-containing sensor histidine kinase [Patescibacteria group bacterium]